MTSHWLGRVNRKARKTIAHARQDHAATGISYVDWVVRKSKWRIQNRGWNKPVKTPYSDLGEFLDEIQRKLALPNIDEQLLSLATIYYQGDSAELNSLDPFGDAYRTKVLEFYKQVSKNSHYDPMEMEKTNAADTFQQSFCPLPYRFGSSKLISEFLSAYAWVFRNLDVRSGADVLEYGAGEGSLCIPLARMGCNVHAIDIEQRFLDVIRKQCNELGISVATKLGRFGDSFDGKLFDRVIFFEAFHHCFDHYQTLMRIRDYLKPDGFICFSGEPVINEQSPDSILVPYPWGLRLDGEAMRSTSQFGWMELGYSEPYFLELLARCGYSVERSPCPSCSRGDVYIARKITSRYPIERDTLISTYKGQSGWHASEHTHRWTDGDAWLPLPATGFSSVAVTLQNLSPASSHVEVSSPVSSERLSLAPAADARVVVQVPPSGGNLRIRSGTFRPKSADTRILGIAVMAVEFA